MQQDRRKSVQKISLEKAVGLPLAHDITEVRPGQYKGPSFRKGHRIESKDLCHLMRLGKRHLYLLDLDKNQVHEDEAVLEFACADERVLLTLNRKHFIRLHQIRPDHGGITACTFDPDFVGQAVRLHAAIESESSMMGKLIRINRPAI